MDQTEIPRRNQQERLTAPELAIRAAIEAVEFAGAHVFLTDTLVHLESASNSLADYIDLLIEDGKELPS